MDLSSFDKCKLVDSFAGDSDLPGLDAEYYKGWFVRQTLKGKICLYRAPEAELDHILQQMLAYFCVTANNEMQFVREREQITKVVWPWLRQRLEHNKGLVKFMREYGVYSRYFVPLMRSMPGALALCPAHGECLDIFGIPQKIPKTDKLYHFAQKDEMYAFARLRADDAKPELENAQHALILGAGTLQEVRQLKRFSRDAACNLDDAPWLVAYDTDTKLKDYFHRVLLEPLSSFGIDFNYSDFWPALMEQKNRNAFDFIGAWGVASYYDLEDLLSGMEYVLSPDGIIKFDQQILDAGPKFRKRFWDHTLVFDKVVLPWESDMKPRRSVIDAIRYVDEVCARVGLKIDYYKYDPNNEIGIVFQCSHI